MAVKSIFQIDVDDEAFRRFNSIYERFQKSVAGLPATWQKFNQQVRGTRGDFDKMVASMGAQNALMLDAQKKSEVMTRTATSQWGQIERATGRVASHIRNATVSLIGWTSILGGLAGFGTLFGMERLAPRVAAGRRASLGLGTDYGARQAFGGAFSRLVDPEAFLSSVAGAKMDVTRRVGLLGAGLSPAEMAGDTAQTAVALLRHLKQIADTTAPQLYAQIIQARRLGEFVSPEDLQRLRRTSRGELGGLVGMFGANTARFGLPPEVQLAWQTFSTAMTNAGHGIENTFVKGLAPLTPGLTRLSTAFEDIVRTFLQSKTVREWMDKLGDGLEKFAKFVGTPEFKQTVETLVLDLGRLGAAVGNAVAWIVGHLPAGLTGAGPGGRRGFAARRLLHREAGTNPVGDWLSGGGPGRFFRGETKVKDLFGGGRGPAIGAAQAMSGLMAQGFSREDAAAITGNMEGESSLRPGEVNPKSGAFGLMQLLGARKRGFLKWAAATGRDPNSPDAQFEWARMEASGESVKWGGSYERSAYGRALGAGGVPEKTAAFGRYVERPGDADLTASMGRRQAAAAAAYVGGGPAMGAGDARIVYGGSATITLMNETGGAVAPSVNALKY